MTTNKIITFGKYKDQPIEVLIEDTQYSEFLTKQDWFKEKYTWVYNAINNAITLEDTPEHNALQMRFNNEEYRIILARYINSLRKNNNAYVNLSRAENTKVSEKIYTQIVDDLYAFFIYKIYTGTNQLFILWVEEIKNRFDNDGKIIKKYITDSMQLIAYSNHENNIMYFTIDNLLIELEHDKTTYIKNINILSLSNKSLAESILSSVEQDLKEKNSLFTVSSPIFEADNIDVSFSFRASYFDYANELRIELKPTISDDYPSILRKAIKDKINVVFCDNFSASKVNIADVKEMYKSHKIHFIKSSDLCENCNPEQDEFSKYLTKLKAISSDGKCDYDDVVKILKSVFERTLA